MHSFILILYVNIIISERERERERGGAWWLNYQHEYAINMDHNLFNVILKFLFKTLHVTCLNGIRFIIPHATSCGGYNVFDPSVSQSVRQSVRQSCFSCQRNSSETAQQNFLKLCSYEGHNV